MKTAARSALSTVTALLTSAGFKAHVDSRRNKVLGFRIRDGRTLRTAPGIVMFDYTSGNGEFPKMCETLIAAGYTLKDAQGGDKYVEYGCARITAPTAAA